MHATHSGCNSRWGARHNTTPMWWGVQQCQHAFSIYWFFNFVHQKWSHPTSSPHIIYVFAPWLDYFLKITLDATLCHTLMHATPSGCKGRWQVQYHTTLATKTHLFTISRCCVGSNVALDAMQGNCNKGGGRCNATWWHWQSHAHLLDVMGGDSATKEVAIQCHMTPLVNNVDIAHTFQPLRFKEMEKSYSLQPKGMQGVVEGKQIFSTFLHTFFTLEHWWRVDLSSLLCSTGSWLFVFCLVYLLVIFPE